MKMLAAIAALALLFPLSAKAQMHPDSGFMLPSTQPAMPIDLSATFSSATKLMDRISHSALWFSFGVDLGTTWYGIKKDGKYEANPLIGRGAPMARIVIVSTAGTAVADWANHRISKTHPRWAFGLRSGLTALHLFAAGRNMR